MPEKTSTLNSSVASEQKGCYWLGVLLATTLGKVQGTTKISLSCLCWPYYGVLILCKIGLFNLIEKICRTPKSLATAGSFHNGTESIVEFNGFVLFEIESCEARVYLSTKSIWKVLFHALGGCISTRWKGDILSIDILIAVSLTQI